MKKKRKNRLAFESHYFIASFSTWFLLVSLRECKWDCLSLSRLMHAYAYVYIKAHFQSLSLGKFQSDDIYLYSVCLRRNVVKLNWMKINVLICRLVISFYVSRKRQNCLVRFNLDYMIKRIKTHRYTPVFALAVTYKRYRYRYRFFIFFSFLFCKLDIKAIT